MPRILIDANIFLELELGQTKSDQCKEFLRQVAAGKLKAATTDFILDSIAVVMESRGSSPSDIGKFFSSLLIFKGLVIYNLGLQGRISATSEMEKSKLDFDDATSLATMKRQRIKEIVSYDHDFDNIQGITRLEPGTVLA